jgi:hypothetical protein
LAGDIKRILEALSAGDVCKANDKPTLRSVEVLPPLCLASTPKPYTASPKLVEGPWLAVLCRTRLIDEVAEQFPARVES